MDLTSKYQTCNPWPDGDPGKVLFLLDVRNTFEHELLNGLLQHHLVGDQRVGELQQACLNLADNLEGIDSTPLFAAVELPPDTLVAPLRIAWLPSEDAINSGPRLRDLVFGDPRHPGARRGRKILETAPQRMRISRKS